jgi:hypothetical protein
VESSFSKLTINLGAAGNSRRALFLCQPICLRLLSREKIDEAAQFFPYRHRLHCNKADDELES